MAGEDMNFSEELIIFMVLIFIKIEELIEVKWEDKFWGFKWQLIE